MIVESSILEALERAIAATGQLNISPAVVVVGSAAYGLSASFSDVDFRAFIDREAGERRFGPRQPFATVDEKSSIPWIFGQIFAFDHLTHAAEEDLALTAFVYRSMNIVRDPDGQLKELIENIQTAFRNSIPQLTARKYVSFCAERNSFNSTMKHNDPIGCHIYRAQAVRLALECTLLVSNLPYPYPKWLGAEVQRIASNDRLVFDLWQSIQSLLAMRSINSRDALSEVKDRLNDIVDNAFGTSRPNWREKWWEHLQD